MPHYILSQIFGAFIAGLLLMGMYWPQIQQFKAATLAERKPLVANGGPASILCTFPNPDQTYDRILDHAHDLEVDGSIRNLGYLFIIEFFVDSYIVRHSPPELITYL